MAISNLEGVKLICVCRRAMQVKIQDKAEPGLHPASIATWRRCLSSRLSEHHQSTIRAGRRYHAALYCKPTKPTKQRAAELRFREIGTLAN